MSNKPERGAASLKISLSKSQIKVHHGSDGTLLAKKSEAVEGDWDKLIDALKDIGCTWVVPE
jgi:hypothetical protein